MEVPLGLKKVRAFLNGVVIVFTQEVLPVVVVVILSFKKNHQRKKMCVLSNVEAVCVEYV